MTNKAAGRKPAITIARSEHHKLQVFATKLEQRDPELADNLLGELDRARIVEDDHMAAGVVRIGSPVRYETNDGEIRMATLVYPGQADISSGRVSVLTPVGTALLGLQAGQAIDWADRSGRRHTLRILEVGAAEPQALDTASP
ncbi:nucleoside diphosphate kinase regulator [Pseudaminobacter sp. 19-2017]|uniref:Nucleoside diphosphate kinase regulator n=1 Tax=Pseudaminobacter soli (ex Zhang et al. 2022) TaxID=2831468 RepID=A0A942E1W6_9HYPH|nr:nucleoside diphosphate kinase regulator [Pseudaminobacter soli]MBS3647052.1 nucleoside diphosphate kinase regulator [Pseudaminobacter soli]